MAVGTVEIENVVASTSIGEEIDLERLEQRVPEAQYIPDQFPGAVYRMEYPKAAALIFESGKLVITGADSIEALEAAADAVAEEMRGLGVDIGDRLAVEVHNIVASADLRSRLSLERVAVGLGLENVEYEPEQFPGLVYRLDEPRVVLLLFGSGKVVCTGGTTTESIHKGVGELEKELENLGLL